MGQIIRVAAQSPPVAVAGAIAKQLREEEQAIVQAIGTNAVSQAVTATVLARLYLAPEGLDLSFVPEFVHVVVKNKEYTAMCFNVSVVSTE